MEEEQSSAGQRAEALRRVGHSLRTPLNAITGASRILDASELTLDQRSSLDVIDGAADALLSAINDLLDISEIEMGRIDLQQIPFRLPDAIREAVRPVRTLAADRGIEVSLHGLSSLPTDVVGDPGRFRQVLTRLVDNAVKYSHSGRVQVGAGLVDHDRSRATVRFAVRDTGAGIATEEFERIFEPFAQGGDGAGAVSAGLGLPISQAVVRAMGGEIRVASRVGQGSTFDFTLTFARHVTEDGADGPTSLANRWVVIVGDRPASNRALSASLRSAGLEPADFTEIPLAAASIALSDDPSLAPAALIAAPTANPFAFAAKVLRDPHLSKVPLVLVPPQGARGDGEECTRLGIPAYLPQPVSPVDLVEAVRVLAASPGATSLITRHWLRERRHRLRVLVVDDSPTGRALVMRGLDAIGHDTAAAATGVEALEALDQRSFDVVLMDMEMPEMDGIEATKAIRARGSAIPIIGLSAHAFNADRQACLEAGMDDHIVKPFRIEGLQIAMERLVDSGEMQPR
ncbi:MAG TPA: response regulator [Acidimicrobiia bacterium]|nr:response regulator [Acidimicrobiia bacterium]